MYLETLARLLWTRVPIRDIYWDNILALWRKQAWSIGQQSYYLGDYCVHEIYMFSIGKKH